MTRVTIVLLLLWLTLPNSGAETADTPETRRVQAERYIAAINPREMLSEFFDKATANLPHLEREKRRARLALVDIEELTKTMEDVLVKHMTTAELKALADFYGSPVGKSAMKKWGDCMVELAPVIRALAQKADAKFEQIDSR